VRTSHFYWDCNGSDWWWQFRTKYGRHPRAILYRDGFEWFGLLDGQPAELLGINFEAAQQIIEDRVRYEDGLKRLGAEDLHPAKKKR
jgi:hypothetical protein